MSNKLKGFGTHAMAGAGIGEAKLDVGSPSGEKSLPKKDIRAVGGTAGGVTTGGTAAKGPAKQSRIGGGKGISTAGKGPTETLKSADDGWAGKKMSQASTSKLGGKGVRPQP